MLYSVECLDNHLGVFKVHYIKKIISYKNKDIVFISFIEKAFKYKYERSAIKAAQAFNGKVIVQA